MPAASFLLSARAGATVVAAVAALALTGCVDAGTGPGLPTGSASPSSPSDTPTPAATPTAEPDALDITCAELIDLDAVYAFDPNYALLDSWEPEADSPAAEAIASGGVACRLVRESGGGTIDVSVALLGEDAIREKKNAAFASSTMVPTYGEEAYFEVEDGVGTAIVFQGEYWLVMSSESFAEPGEPTEIIDAALAAL